MRAIPVRGATAPSDAPTITPAPRRRAPAWAQVRAALACELAVAALLLAVALAVTPDSARLQVVGGAVWDYQRDPIRLAGTGALNTYSRVVLGATAWAARASIERQRDVARLDLLGFAAGTPAVAAVSRWRQAHRVLLEAGTVTAVVSLLAYGLLARPAQRTWLAALLLVLASTLVITQPRTVARLAATPGVAVQDVAASAAVRLRLAAPPGDGTALTGVLQPLAARYWTAFVGRPLSQLQTGSPLLADAPPADKASRLMLLRGRFRGVDDWARGRHTVERAAIATLAAMCAMPVALALVVLAMAAACAQALLLLLLCLATLLVLPLAVDDRRRAVLVRYWLVPLGGAAALLAAMTIASLLLLWLAAAVRAIDEQVGVVAGGGALPLLAVVLITLLRRRRAVAGDAR